MRIALITGINYYKHHKCLYGCVNDAYQVNSILERNGDGSVNFDTKLMIADSPENSIERGEIKDSIEQLFKMKEAETVLFYFAGHAHIEATGGYLTTSDSKRGDSGVSLSEILTLANESPATNKIIILDSCHSGAAGTPPGGQIATLSEGLTVLTASTKDQYASEKDGSGLFTTLLVDALSGGAANLIGQITPASVYAHIDQSLGGWEQRPVFKTNTKKFVSLRSVSPSLQIIDLRRIIELFPLPGFEFKLDPTFEPEMKGRDKEMPPPDPKNTQIFAILQKYNRVNLLVPVEAQHMWNAAMEYKKCKLTALGEHYRRLVAKNRI